jgi:hypothetical protein
MIIEACAQLSSESLYDVGKKAGLKGDALNYFRYFTEVALLLSVDEKTGSVTKAEIKKGA